MPPPLLARVEEVIEQGSFVVTYRYLAGNFAALGDDKTPVGRGEDAANSDDPTAMVAMAQLLDGAWIARVIHTAAELPIVDYLGDNPRDAISLAM